ncbi:acyl-CoA synthetase (AMP-forming)/AMP-acid ligase II [Rhodococcus wratislaviensis IFP 2016]|nr:acyl-CoA synthetase (AMP-forming)/AMP-acid ligase II [Rhodococcus wratislaviensis IFP 2016]
MTTSGQDEDLLLAVVRDLVAERRTVDRAAPATLDSEFGHDLGLDSLGVTELLARTEDAFGVSLDRGVLATVETPRDLMTAVRRAPSRSRLPSIPVRHPAPPPIARTPDATATLTEALSWHARTHPDRVHLRILSGGTEDEGTQDEVCYGELQSAAATVSAALLARDLRAFPPRCGHLFLCGGGQRSRSLLELDRTDLAESGMPPSGVVSRDPAEHGSARLARAVPAFPPLQRLPFQRRIQRLGGRVVRRRSDRTPRPGHPQLAAEFGEFRRCILSSVVAVKRNSV